MTDETQTEPVPEPVAATAAAETEPPQHRSFLRELPFLVVLALLLTLGLRYFVVQAFYIPSNSMEKTLMVGDRVLVNKIPYIYRGPHRGEIVVFNGLDNFDEGVTFSKPTSPVGKLMRKISNTIGLGAPDEKDYIKRVIGVAGDRVMCCDAQGRVVVTPKGGQPTALDEPYIYENDTSGVRYFCQALVDQQKRVSPDASVCPPGAEGILVPKGRLWVMGDHRADSADSRYHVNDPYQGTVPVSKVIGRAAAVVYPLGHWRTLRVPDTFHRVALPAVPLMLGTAGALPLTLLRRRLRRRAA